jgi:hypothetical protein
MQEELEREEDSSLILVDPLRRNRAAGRPGAIFLSLFADKAVR